MPVRGPPDDAHRRGRLGESTERRRALSSFAQVGGGDDALARAVTGQVGLRVLGPTSLLLDGYESLGDATSARASRERARLQLGSL